MGTRSYPRVPKARKLLLADAIDAADFKAIKPESEEKITRLERRIGALSEEFNIVPRWRRLFQKRRHRRHLSP